MQIFIRPQGVKAISFDLDDTLYDNRPIIANAERELIQFLHQQYPKSVDWQPEQWRKVKRQVLAQQPALADDPSAARQRVLKQGLLTLGYSNDEASLGAKQGFDCFYHHRSHYKVADEVIALLAQLAQKYPVIGITNGNVDAERIGLSHVMRFVINTGNGLRMKPKGDMFELACQKLAIEPQALLHVGDSLSSDVMGAKLAGCQSVWLNPAMGRDFPDELTHSLPHVAISELEQLKMLMD